MKHKSIKYKPVIGGDSKMYGLIKFLKVFGILIAILIGSLLLEGILLYGVLQQAQTGY